MMMFVGRSHRQFLLLSLGIFTTNIIYHDCKRSSGVGVLAVAASSSSSQQQRPSPPKWYDLDKTYTFEQYVIDFHKSYDNDSDNKQYRKNIFETNFKHILQHNNDFTTTGRGHVLGVNHFTDLESNEIPFGYDKSISSNRRQQHALSLSKSTSSTTSISAANAVQTKIFPWRKKKNHHGHQIMDLPFKIDNDISKLPKFVDWRQKGITTPVKDQGGCGSCWAFASIATLESHVAKETGVLFELSPQELVSCVSNPKHCGGSGGCAGATAELAYDFVASANNGIVQEYQFGYQSYHGKQINCTILKDKEHKNQYNLLRGDDVTTARRIKEEEGPDPPGIESPVATIEGYSVLPSNDYVALMNAVAKYGPVVVSVAASGWGSYAGGVYSPPTKDDNSTSYKEQWNLNHAVVLMGYGTDNTTNEDYWLIRNSWRPTWGENGYIRLKRTDPTNKVNNTTTANKNSTATDFDCGMDVTPGDGDACSYDENGNPLPTPLPAVKVCGTNGILFDSVVPVGGKLL